MSDFWDNLFRDLRGRRGSPFPNIERMIEEIEEKMENLLPRDMIRRLPDAPLIYSYSIQIGPNGKPLIREFGNTNPGQTQLNLHEMQPLIDILEDDKNVEVIAELPGVQKKDIHLHATERTITINVDTPERRYRRKLELPGVDESSARSTYENGILRITFKKEDQDTGTRIEIEG